MTEEILFMDRDDWRKWLKLNHDKSSRIWLKYYKKHTEKESVRQPEAVEEALCYGWIDSIVKRIDEEQYMQKFTPRNDNSIWSDVNKKRVAQLIKNGKMTEFGMKKINTAKKNGMWNKIKDHTKLDKLPVEIEAEISNNDTFRENWEKLAPSRKKQFLYWINDAKKDETKIRRINKAIEMIINNNLGMM
jgi:uncharacterized protein YdeI (YjbR/CyaY-like superfamily)